MHGFNSLATISLSTIHLIGQSSAWTLGFWASQPLCASHGGAADTTRGGEPCQEQPCNLVAIDTVQAVLISDWDDGCTIALYAEDMTNFPCGNKPFWEFSKEEYVDSGRYNETEGVGCITGVDNRDVLSYFSYTCDTEEN